MRFPTSVLTRTCPPHYHPVQRPTHHKHATNHQLAALTPHTMTDSARAVSSLASVPDNQLDAYIADLIVQKSKAKEARSEQHGMAAVLDNADHNVAKVPNTNKRFLASVIRNVEGHNQALLRQQAKEERSQSASARRREQDGTGGPSRLRGWSDDEDEDSYRSENRRTEEEGEELGLSSKMDKYFERASHAERSDSQSSRLQEPQAPSMRVRQKERSKPNRRSDRHSNDESHASPKSSSSRHRERSPHESRRDKSKRSRDDRHYKSEEEEHRHALPSKHKSVERRRSHRSSHVQRDNGSDDEEPDRRRRKAISQHWDRVGSHRDRSSKRSTSPPPEPPKRVREWDLGKNSFAF